MEDYITESSSSEIDEGFLKRVENGETKININREMYRDLLKKWSDKKDGRRKLERYSAEIYIQGYRDAFLSKEQNDLLQVPFEDILETISHVEGVTNDILKKIEIECDKKYGG